MAAKEPLVIVGDFNAPSLHWGYHFEQARGCKAVNTDNLRPISLTSCAGKLTETMVRDRLSPYLESKGFFAVTLFGFCPHMSAQDVLLQLHRDVIRPTTMQHNDKAILALDLKGAFDNVKHGSILANLSSTDCGARAYAYVRDFLTNRQAFLRIEGEEHGPYMMGTRGTPQGAVLSPLLFNIAMMRLPSQLARVEGIQHALYADDITIWTTEGSLGDMEARLQQAASIVDALRPDSTIVKLKRVGEQVGRMISRVSNKRGGLRGRDALRLVYAFVTSRILYAVPYLRTTKQDEARIDAIIRKATKRALDLPVATSNAKLKALGVRNSYQELREAHLVNQYTYAAHADGPWAPPAKPLTHPTRLHSRGDGAYPSTVVPYALGLPTPP
nr:putative nicotine oxidoreductase [Dermacentor andersoni]